ncbi:hypothetical protein SAMN05421504_103850 [Amycolatopsis xylanica]|uniref:Condensation domain-containing protein n=1 Tax=Amycolatopsis xylanica TaxID=589385 RepID=A0A1H3EJV4_9PSEU|nr:hypothetical protein SAMN05421504_103850 [Amycolatopsis xylanica]
MSQSASDQAHSVVGLYGDPTVSWSILIEACLFSVLPAEAVRERLRDATVRYPHLGAPPAVEPIRAAEIPQARARFAERPYDRGAPLIRVAVCTDEPVVLVAAHHGALDGLGLLAVLGIVVDSPLSSGAKGIGARSAGTSFLASAAKRLAEALFAPPARITPGGGSPSPGDVFSARNEPRMRCGTAELVAAAAHATERWNGEHGRSAARVVAAIGASCRAGAAPEPDRDSAFFRLRVSSAPVASEVGTSLAAQAPEPDFPARSSTIARLGTRLLASRLGSTFLVSNLGVIEAECVRSIAFYPAASGRSGVAFGAATVGGTSTVTVRARRKDFDGAAAGRLADGVVDALRRQGARARSGQPGDVAHQ